ncbi:fimbrial protein [Escherichia coli]|uniref:fimbrial protein n=1 Tax=Escherichia coli TaxID=562 RepID=UPI0030F3B2A9
MKIKIISTYKVTSRETLLLLVILIAAFVPSLSFAKTCSYASGGPALVSFSDISINSEYNKNTAPGTIIFDRSYHSSHSGQITCSDNYPDYSEGFATSPSTLVGSDICLFNVPLTNGKNSGIGIKIFYDLKNNNTTPNNYCMEYPKRTSTANKNNFSVEGNFRIQLKVIGELQSGEIDLSRFSNAGIWWNNIEAFSLEFSNTIINLHSLSCDLNTPDVPVSLSPAAGINSDITFKGINSTSALVDFNIGLTCDPGTNVAIRFEGDTVSGSNNSILKLTQQNNSASGVGVQILDKNKNIIPLNQPDYVLQLSNIQQSATSLNFSARYIQTESNVTPGKADADADATFYLSFP